MVRFDAVRDWMFQRALPFWSRAGVDREGGGFVEHLSLSGQNGQAPFKRVRVQARQIYVFSHAALMGAEGAGDLALHGWRFLDTYGRTGEGAWARRLSPTGEVLDATCDAYDMAFVLFAHAWLHRLTRDAAVVESAVQTVAGLRHHLSHPNGLGFLAEAGDLGPRQQNPHMHLLEAAVELADTTGHDAFHELGQDVLELFQSRIVEAETGVLREFFAPDWSRLSTDQGRFVEPGHQFEWAWLLHRAAPILDVGTAPLARGLYDWAQAHGVDPNTGLTLDQVWEDGRARSCASRSWPQTEALKAHLALFETEGLNSRAHIAACVSNLLDRYLSMPPDGAWIDQLDAEGRPDVDKIPASTFYHLWLAFAELLRLQPNLEA